MNKFSALKDSARVMTRRHASTIAGASRTNRNVALGAAGAVSAFAVYAAVAENPFPWLAEVRAEGAADHGLHPAAYPWPHKGLFDTFDHASIRRGYQVYREVCSTCHSLDRIAWRNLVGVSHTVDEARAMAEECEYTDGPDNSGEFFQRPGKLSDYLQPPYPNDEAARSANAGALPPDLSLIIKARHGGPDYVYSILTGYYDAPAGVEVREGLNYNPYFPGGAIAMGRTLFDGIVEYEDGTPATTSQMAKDVVTFLNWAAEPEHDQRKKMGLQACTIIAILFGLSIYGKRFRFAGVKSRKVIYDPPSKH